MGISDIATSVRRDEYTGENRCLPCTVLNVFLAATAAGVITWAGYPLIAAAALVVCFTTIYLRGYLVPGTPTITKRYLPEVLLRLFGKEPGPERLARADSTELTNVSDALFVTGVLTDGRTDEGPRLGTRFREAWWDSIETIREREIGREDVIAMLDAEECTAQSEVSFVVDGTKLIRWESKAALVADVAAAATLSTSFEGWPQLDRSKRLDVLTGLRLFLERCPACDGSVSRTERQVDSCCQPSYTVVRSTCEECDSTIAEVSVLEADDETSARLQFHSS